MSINIVILISVIHCGIALIYEYDVISLMEQIINSTKLNIQSHRATLITESLENLSFTSMLIIREITKGFSVVTVQSGQLANQIVTPRLSLMRKSLASRSLRLTLMVFVIDGYDANDIEKKFIDIVKFFKEFTTKSPRPKCLIFLISENGNTNLLSFFEYAWENSLLDITVMELIKGRSSENILLSPSPDSINTTIIHQYNPFNQTYMQETYVANTNVFINKIKDLYGYPLKIGFFDVFPQVMLLNNGVKNYSVNNIWDNLYGIDYEITNIFKQKFNFSITIKVIGTSMPKLQNINVTKMEPLKALDNNIIDYLVNTFYMTGRQPLEKYDHEIGTFLYLSGTVLIVKQYKQSQVHISKDFLIILSSLAISFIFFIIFVKLMGLNNQIWNFRQIIQIIVGTSVPHVPAKSSQRLIFATLCLASFLYSFELMQNLFVMKIKTESFPKLETVRDVIDSGVIPYITVRTKNLFASKNYMDLQDLFSLSKTNEIEDWNTAMEYCVLELIKDDGKIDACDVKAPIGDVISQSYSDKESDWIITSVTEQFGWGWSSLQFSKISPYIQAFNSVARHLYDTGIIDYITSSAKRNFTFNSKQVFRNKIEHLIASKNHAEDAGRVLALSLDKILIFFACGYFVASLVFAYELLLFKKQLALKSKKL